MAYLKNIGTLVKVLRRFLLLGLVLLCSILLYREFTETENNHKKETPPQEELQSHLAFAEWGDQVEKLARRLDKPIFFYVNNNFEKEISNDSFIRKYFVCTTLDPSLYPADYIALKTLHSNVGEDVNVTCGVLTSKMYPILTTSSNKFEDKGDSPSIKAMLKGIISVYYESYNRFLKISKNFYLLNDIPSKYHINDLKDDGAKLSFMLDFGFHEKFTPAQLSESARLTFRNCTVEKYSPSITRIRNVAFNEIMLKTKNKDDLSFTEKTFYLRALAEYIIIFDDFTAQDLLLENAQKILASQDNDGAFLIEGNKDSLHNAFSLNIINYAYKITGEEVYLKSMKKFANFLEKELKSHTIIRSDFKRGGIAGAKGYVYLSRAVLNAYLVCFDEKFLNLTHQLLSRLDKDHKTLNCMVLELSEESPLAKYINFCSVEDSDYTSTNGVLLQIYKDMNTLKLSKNLDIRIKNIFDATLDSLCGDIDFDFSLRMAKYTNPLISLDTIKRFSEKDAEIKDIHK